MSSTRSKLIDLLAKYPDTYVSGQMLSESLQISRSAVWKHMKELEKAGYVIDSKPKKGYRIVEFPEKVNENTLRWGLKTEWLGQKIIHKETTTSTQYLAHNAAQNGAVHGTIIVADEQTNSKGRMNRKWHSKKNKGIWLSMILRPEILPSMAPQLTLLTGVVLAQTIEQHGKIQPFIKWPNDIIINNRKAAGILTEIQVEQDRINYVVIGIGINVNQDRNDFHADIENRATSLALESNSLWSINDLIQHILVKFETTYSAYLSHGFPFIKTIWESYGFRIGETVAIRTMKEKWQATLMGISEDGALLVEDESGKIKKMYSAEIDWFSNDE